MGVQLGTLVRLFNIEKIVSPSFFSNKIVIVDALPTIYEMLAMIRDKHGLYLVDSKGRVTSHLIGLFTRICRMLITGIKPVFVFDGPPHPLKTREIEKRKEEKMIFQNKYIEAVLSGRYEEARKLGKRAMFVNDEMIRSSRQLITLFGLPIVDAPHDGEAQTAYMVKKGDGFVTAVRDWDAFLYGAPRIVMDLKLSPNPYYKPRFYELDAFLFRAELTIEQLIDVGILIGTDFNPGGVTGIGPKTAYKLIKRYGSLDNLIKSSKIKWRFDVSYLEIREIYLNPPINNNYKIEFSEPKFDHIIRFLVEEYNFSRKRVLNELNELKKKYYSRRFSQKRLDEIFK